MQVNLIIYMILFFDVSFIFFEGRSRTIQKYYKAVFQKSRRCYLYVWYYFWAIFQKSQKLDYFNEGLKINSISMTYLNTWFYCVSMIIFKECASEECVLAIIGNKIDLCENDESRVVKYKDGSCLADVIILLISIYFSLLNSIPIQNFFILFQIKVIVWVDMFYPIFQSTQFIN